MIPNDEPIFSLETTELVVASEYARVNGLIQRIIHMTQWFLAQNVRVPSPILGYINLEVTSGN